MNFAEKTTIIIYLIKFCFHIETALYDLMTFFYEKKRSLNSKLVLSKLLFFLNSLVMIWLYYNITFLFSRPYFSCLFSHKIQIRKQNISVYISMVQSLNRVCYMVLLQFVHYKFFFTTKFMYLGIHEAHN
jgi:hypothetical protein